MFVKIIFPLVTVIKESSSMKRNQRRKSGGVQKKTNQRSTSKKLNSKSTTKKRNSKNLIGIIEQTSNGPVLKKVTIFENKLKKNQLTVDLNKRSEDKINQIISSYKPNNERVRDINYELLKLHRLKSVFKILEVIGKKVKSVDNQLKKGKNYIPSNNTSYRFAIDQLTNNKDLDYVEGVIYSKKNNVIIPHSWNYNRKTKKHIDYSIKTDKGDFVYYGVVINGNNVCNFCEEVYGKDYKVNESILELCTLNSKQRKVDEEIEKLRQRFILQKTYKT